MPRPLKKGILLHTEATVKYLLNATVSYAVLLLLSFQKFNLFERLLLMKVTFERSKHTYFGSHLDYLLISSKNQICRYHISRYQEHSLYRCNIHQLRQSCHDNHSLKRTQKRDYRQLSYYEVILWFNIPFNAVIPYRSIL